jgi:hypothetical protein
LALLVVIHHLVRLILPKAAAVRQQVLVLALVGALMEQRAEDPQSLVF